MHVHGERDRFTVSVDASGPEPLHRRGSKPRVGVAPLKETLAAAVLSAVCEAEGLWEGAEAMAPAPDSKAIPDMVRSHPSQSQRSRAPVPSPLRPALLQGAASWAALG